MKLLTDEEINQARSKTTGLPLVCKQQHRDIAQDQLDSDIKSQQEERERIIESIETLGLCPVSKDIDFPESEWQSLKRRIMEGIR